MGKEFCDLDDSASRIVNSSCEVDVKVGVLFEYDSICAEWHIKIQRRRSNAMFDLIFVKFYTSQISDRF